MTRLGGEYRAKGKRDRATWEGRVRFLAAFERLVPEALEELRDTVLPVFRELCLGGIREEKRRPRTQWGIKTTIVLPPPWFLSRFQEGDWEGARVSSLPGAADLRDAVLAWAAEYHREEPWFLDVALGTLRSWNGLPESPNTEGVANGDLHFRLPPPADLAELVPFLFEYEHEAWVPHWTSWTEYKEEVDSNLLSAFHQALNEYRKARETAVDEDLEPSPEIRPRAGRSEDRAFEWIVLHRVRRLTYAEIAETTGRLEARSVAHQVRKYCKLIGLR